MCNLILKNYTNELIYKTERFTDFENKLLVSKGKPGEMGVGGRRDQPGAWEERTHTAVYKINNQQGLIVYSRRNSAQYSGITHEKTIWKIMNTCIAETLCVHLKLIQHGKPTVLQ